ncbi:MAG: hypothetical protein ACSLE6_12525 [Mycobacterium sp.]
MLGKLEEIREAAQTRYNRAILLGYHEAAGIGNTLAGGMVLPQPGMDITWHVWSIDQPSDTAKIFRSVAAVDEHVANVSTLPRYYLTLEGNPRMVVEAARDSKNVRITDTESGEHFAIRGADLDGFKIRSAGPARLCVHTAPTIGDWIQE